MNQIDSILSLEPQVLQGVALVAKLDRTKPYSKVSNARVDPVTPTITGETLININNDEMELGRPYGNTISLYSAD